MKIASYNISSGGFNGYNPVSFKPERIEVLKQAIKIIDADFVGLIDTFRWDEIYRENGLKQLFDYKNNFCINLNDERLKKKGHNNGIAVLTNLVVYSFKTINLLTRDAIKTEVQIKDKPVDIFSVYLDDLNENTRISQITELLRHVTNKPTILLGDLNTVYPEDRPKLKSDLNHLLLERSEFKERDFKELLRAEVIPLIKSKGFVGARGDGPRTSTAATSLSKQKFGAIFKIDHIFHSPDIKVEKFQVLKGSIFEKASDHYPIVAKLSDID